MAAANKSLNFWKRTNYVRYYYNWDGDGQLPIKYGVLIEIPTPDPLYSLGFYFTPYHAWIGQIMHDGSYKASWTQVV